MGKFVLAVESNIDGKIEREWYGTPDNSMGILRILDGEEKTLEVLLYENDTIVKRFDRSEESSSVIKMSSYLDLPELYMLATKVHAAGNITEPLSVIINELSFGLDWMSARDLLNIKNSLNMARKYLESVGSNMDELSIFEKKLNRIIIEKSREMEIEEKELGL